MTTTIDKIVNGSRRKIVLEDLSKQGDENGQYLHNGNAVGTVVNADTITDDKGETLRGKVEKSAIYSIYDQVKATPKDTVLTFSRKWNDFEFLLFEVSVNPTIDQVSFFRIAPTKGLSATQTAGQDIYYKRTLSFLSTDEGGNLISTAGYFTSETEFKIFRVSGTANITRVWGIKS